MHIITRKKKICRSEAYCSSKHAIEGLSGTVWHETKSFCRVMCFELGFFSGTEIAQHRVTKTTEIECYKNLDTFYVPLIYNFKNNLNMAITAIINKAEERNLPRRFILGKDALQTVQAEINYLKKDLRASRKDGKRCSIRDKDLLNIVFNKTENEFHKIYTIFGIKLKIKVKNKA